MIPAAALLALAACVVDGAGPAGALPPIAPNRPTFSDGTSLVPAGRVQVETGVSYARREGQGVDAERGNGPELVVRYAASPRLELRATWGGQVWSDAGGGGSDDGGSDAGLAVLVPLADQVGWQPALTLEAATTLGVGSAAFSSGHADPTWKLLWSYGAGELPQWLGVGGNLVASYPTENGDRFTQTAASLYATFSPIGTDTSLFAEWYVVSRPANSVASSQAVDFGVVQRLSGTVAVDARAGFGLDDRADDFVAGIGISLLF
ncbi:MAG: transporter [Planctomycetes bacterium]|nr:transporter [Planctomycetota bacterium]